MGYGGYASTRNLAQLISNAMYSPKSHKKARTGSVQIRSSNNRLQLVFSFCGKRHFVSTGLGDSPFNRKQAQDKALEVERDIAYGEFDPNNLDKYKALAALTTVDPTPTNSNEGLELPEIWNRYREVRSPKKSASTIRMYGWVANHISRCPYKLLTEAQAIFDWLHANVPADSTKRVLTQLSASCKWAKKSGLIGGNPFQGMASEIKLEKPDGEEEEEINPFTREERDRIVAAFKADRYYKRYAPLVEFLFFTGCRPSEALALQWKHIGRQEITFRRVFIYNGKKFLIQEGLKTQKLRKFTINAQLAEIITSIKPENFDPEALVFPSPEGKHIDWHNFTARAWKKVLGSLSQDIILPGGEVQPGIEYRNPYQMRHTFCSLCREQDIPSIQLAKWVGNSAEMIDRVYAKPVSRISVPIL